MEGMPSQEQMNRMMELARPGEHHQHMHKLAGNWKAHVRFWMQPGAPPSESDGTAMTTPLLGGRFFQTDFKGTFGPDPFTGLSIDGYDNQKKKHFAFWMDSMGTMALTFEGDCGQNGKVTKLKADFTDCMTGQPTTMRTVMTVLNDNKMLWESFMKAPDGAEFKNMEITYSRQ